jgi:hypothetical protein
MTLRTHISDPNYSTERRNKLFGAEAVRTFAYVDSRGIPTIGLGLNLRTHIWYVLELLGFDVRETTLTGVALTVERGYIAQIKALVDARYVPNNTASNQVLAALNGVLQSRANDPAYDGVQVVLISSFEFSTAAVAEQRSLDLLDTGYAYSVSTSQGRDQPVALSSYESQLNSRLAVASPLRTLDSKERIALLSMVFNGSSTMQLWLDGGDGNDLLQGFGVSVLTGGAGSDILFAGTMAAGESGDRLYGNIEVTPEAAILAGETAFNNRALGDVLSAAGSASDDLLIGTDTRDVLAGGGGKVDWRSERLQIIAMHVPDEILEGDRTVMQSLLLPVRRVVIDASEGAMSANSSTLCFLISSRLI